MALHPWRGSALACCLIGSTSLVAVESADPAALEATKAQAFKLGETVVVAAKDDPIETVNTRVDAAQMEDFHKDNVAAALDMVPGVQFVAGGARNEQGVLVRGLDSRSVPMFLDGVPIHFPYDGDLDYGRFTTFDLAEIQVEKGFSSIAFGANTLGGAINLVTRRPVAALEGDVRAGLFEGSGRKAALNLGSNQGTWYFQVGGSTVQADTFPLSSNFQPNSRQAGDQRGNADYKDRKLSVKVALTPNDKDEYAIGFSRQVGEKGQPVSTDLRATARYWRWPQYDKNSLYYVSNTSLGDASYVRLRAYYDTYKNLIANYRDATFTTYASGWQKSYYDDFTHGVMLEGGTELIPRNSLKVILQTKTDVHREGDGSRPDTALWLNYEDQYLCAGLEDSLTLSDTVNLSLGAGWDHLKPIHSGPTWALPNTQSVWHGQAGVFWKVRPKVQLYATIAQKDRFPTLKDRYSSKFATHIPNPDLRAERSTNYEIGLKDDRSGKVHLEADLFLADVRDLIADFDTGTPLSAGSSSHWMQMRNVSKVRQSGVELAVDVKPVAWFQGGLGYTYLDRRNLTYSSQPLMDTPHNRITAYGRVMPAKSVYVQAALRSQDSMWDNTSSYTTRLGGFTTLDLTAGWTPVASLKLDAGFNNLLDRNYAYATGYPMAGRTAFVNAKYSF
jgi:iron complex outermembrane receptor protein